MSPRPLVSSSGGLWSRKKCATAPLSPSSSSTTQRTTDPHLVRQPHLFQFWNFETKTSLKNVLQWFLFPFSQDITVDGKHQEVPLKNLTPGTSYSVFVEARAENGSTRSIDLTFRTKRYGEKSLVDSYIDQKYFIILHFHTRGWHSHWKPGKAKDLKIFICHILWYVTVTWQSGKGHLPLATFQNSFWKVASWI